MKGGGTTLILHGGGIDLKKLRDEAFAAGKAMLAIVAIAFVTDALILWSLNWLGTMRLPGWVLGLAALVLALVIAPPIYFLVLIPLRREYEKRLRAEGRAEAMTRLAITDPLTHVMNRRGITVALLDAMAQAERYDTPLTVAMADIDHFKAVNDNYGHETGDRALAEVAAVLTEQLRMPDKVGRYGGEEFLIVLPHTALAQGRKIAERVRAAVAKAAIEFDGKRLSLTVSIGVTQFHKGEDLEQLLSRADQALYEAKNAGRNRVVVRKRVRRGG
jgi:diguanylate cyclase (GGDEF)-like protein